MYHVHVRRTNARDYEFFTSKSRGIVNAQIVFVDTCIVTDVHLCKTHALVFQNDMITE